MPKFLIWNYKMAVLLFAFVFFGGGKPVYAQTAKTPYDSILEVFGNSMHVSADSSLVLFDEMITHYRAKGDSCRYARAMLQQAVNRLIFGEISTSLNLLHSAQNTFETSHCSPMFQAKVSLVYSQLYSLKGDYRLSDSIALQAISEFDTSWSDKATYIKLYSQVYRQADDVEITLPFLQKAVDLSRRYNYPYLEQRALNDLAVTYAIMGNFDTAKLYFQRSLIVARAEKDYLSLGTIYNNLAGLSSDNKNIQTYLDSALYYAELNGNMYHRQNFTENQAFFYYENGKYQKAYDYLWAALGLKDSLYNKERYTAHTELEKKYQTEKKSNEIQALKLTNLNAELEAIKYKKNANRLILGTLVLLIIASIAIYGFITIRNHRNVLALKNKEISEARHRSDELLLNILPASIAEELKENGSAKARDFEQATILFTDFKDFTKFSANTSSNNLVEELNTCFQAFDYTCDKYGIEKIKTIGDAYMAAGGLSAESISEVKNTVLAALEMQDFITKRKADYEAADKPAFSMRVGIHTGPVVAGIVGVKKFQYDIWGDTVNTASRMESSGDIGKVNISQATYELLKDDQQFEFESRGKIAAKGKGEIEMYFVSKT